MERAIYEIAQEVRKDWKNVNYAAKPYLDAMGSIEKVTDPYIAETGRDVVVGFLCNASTWRGVVARRVKAELKKQIA